MQGINKFTNIMFEFQNIQYILVLSLFLDTKKKEMKKENEI